MADEKFVEKITGGRVKNLGAKITGLQFALKGLAGPLGRAFRIDDRGSLARYLRPAMEEAQRQGHGAVGAKALGQKKYNELVPDRLANLAIGVESCPYQRIKSKIYLKVPFDEKDEAKKLANKHYGI